VTVGEVTVGEVTVGEVTIGEVTIGEVTVVTLDTRLYHKTFIYVVCGINFRQFTFMSS